jgi:uncharacterized protein (TIGR04551 family)
MLFAALAAVFVVAVPQAVYAAEVKEEGSIEEEAPQLKFLELHGYLRLRSDLFYKLDLGTYNYMSGSYSSRVLPPITGRVKSAPDIQTPPTQGPMSGNTLAGANMRFRVEPTLNISDEIKIKAQIDMLDNIVLGSLPESYNGQGGLNEYYPMPAFTATQVSPHKGINSYVDSIAVKRAWAEVTTPFGQLRFGRMPSQWGMGVLINDGSCFDCDGGNTADRVMFLTKFFNHYFGIAYDFPSEGPTSKMINNTNNYPLESYYQPWDADQRDDVQQYLLLFARRDKPEEIKEQLENGKVVVNYGLYNALRLQAYDFQAYYLSGTNPSTMYDLGRRDVVMYIGSPWFKLIWKKLHIEFEVDFIAGQIGDAITKCADVFNASCTDPTFKNLSVFQWGGVLLADYKFLHDKLKVGLEIGVASGDNHPGWGTQPLASTVTGPDGKDHGYAENPFGPRQFGDYYDSNGNLVQDRDIMNFRFNPDYRIDQILWREVIGQFTDGIYIKPSIQYLIAEGFGVGLDIIYSRALYWQSTPGNDENLGLEFDLHVFYNSEDGFVAGVDYGVLVPFGGLDNLGADHVRGGTIWYDTDLSAQVAQRIHAYLGVVF